MASFVYDDNENLLSFASAQDYEARYGVDVDEERLTTILQDATMRMVNAYEAFWGTSYKEGDHPEFDRAATAVCCAIAHRALAVPAGFEGASQYSQTAGSYNASITFSNPTGDLYLGSSDLKALGLHGQRIDAIYAKAGDDICED